MSAYDGLADQLALLTGIISGRDDLGDEPELAPELLEKWRAKTQQDHIEKRNSELKDYRRLAHSLRFSGKQDEVEPKPFTTRIFSYLHNEFHFNSPRPIGRIARISHLLLTPLFLERTESSADRDPAKKIGPVTSETLRWLWDQAIHNPAREIRGQESFRGGKDRVFQYVRELFDFSEPFITPKRSILARKDILTARIDDEKVQKIRPINDQARDQTRVLEAQIRQAGLSNRLTNSVEYFWKYLGDEVAHFRWSRHAHPYQTFTFTHECPQDFSTMKFDGTGGDPFERTALHAFPTDFFAGSGPDVAPEKQFAGVFGRYLQGANWLIVPIDAFFDLPVDAETKETFLEALQKLQHDTAEPEQRSRWQELINRLAQKKERGPRETSREVARLIDFASVDKKTGAEIDRLTIAVTRKFLGQCFLETDVENLKNEFVGFKCMDGRAYVFSNVRNNNLDDTAIDPDRDEEEKIRDAKRELFSRTLIIDCGMHKHQRGRLMQNLTEFATERAMALLWIGRFRLLQNALNVIESKINLAVSNYHNDVEQFCPRPDDAQNPRAPKVESVVPHTYWEALHRDVGYDLPKNEQPLHSSWRERKLIIALEFLSSCLTLLNDVVEGGVADRASRTLGATEVLRGKLKSIREMPIVGHQSLLDFIGRRFIPASRVIGRTGERYRRLRDRITEVAELINANLSAREWHEHQKQAKRQTSLLTIAELFGEAALGYYLSNLIVDMLGSLCGSGTIPFLQRICAVQGAAQGELGEAAKAFFYGLGTIVVAVSMGFSLFRMARERREDKDPQTVYRKSSWIERLNA